jgi:hypothetical protein
MLRIPPPLRQRNSGRKSPILFRVNRTTMFVLAIICGEIIRYYLFGFLLQWDSSFLKRPIFPMSKNRRNAPNPCDTDGSATSSEVICSPQQPLNHSTKNSTRRSFQIHVFLYRRVDSAALLLRDLTDAEYKVRCRPRPCKQQEARAYDPITTDVRYWHDVYEQEDVVSTSGHSLDWRDTRRA